MALENHWRLLEKLGLIVVPGFFDADLRARIAHEAHARAVASATLTSKMRLDPDYRRVKVVDVSEETTVMVCAKLVEAQPALSAHFKQDLEWFQDFQLLRYRAGDFYKPHRDADPDDGDGNDRRVATAVIFVNAPGSDYAGGALSLYGLFGNTQLADRGFALNVEPGMLVAFPAGLLHEVAPVERGERLTIAAWYRGRD